MVSVSLPGAFELHQNYPNPFNPSTAIRYRLAEAGMVTLTVHDLLGKEITTLVNAEKQAPGNHMVSWNGQDAFGNPVASGVYFVRMQVGHGVQTRKIMLVK